MTFLLILVIVAGIAATLRALTSDDRGHRSPPSSHAPDPSFLPPGSLTR